jgi:hypothetical protein
MSSSESTSAPVPPRSRLRRRWLRFSLRTLLIVVTLLGIWLGVKVDQARRQKRAVDTLRMLGAGVRYEHQRLPDGRFDDRIELDVPAWARNLCGDDFFQTVRGVYLWRRVSITDEELECLDDLPYLEVLHIDGLPITDAGLAHIPHPHRLTQLATDGTNIGDGFLHRLRSAKRLQTLQLDNSEVTDAGLSALSGISTLRRLSLVGTQTGDKGLATFAPCKQLEALRLGRQVTNQGLQQFETLENITHFRAKDSPITGEAFRGFSLPKVDSVYLDYCAVSDEDLPPLVQAIRNARIFSLDGCPISDDGLQHLRHLGKTKKLSLSHTNIQGHKLRHLASLSGVMALVLSGCPLEDPDLKALAPLYTGTAPGVTLLLDKIPIGDADLAKISGFTNLTDLSVNETNISDAGLRHLYALKKLAVLDLRRTRVTGEGVKQVKKAVSGIIIAWEEDPQPTGWPW